MCVFAYFWDEAPANHIEPVTSSTGSRKWEDRFPSCRLNRPRTSNILMPYAPNGIHTTLLFLSFAKRRLGLCILLGLGFAYIFCICIAGWCTCRITRRMAGFTNPVILKLMTLQNLSRLAHKYIMLLGSWKRFSGGFGICR